MGVYKKQDMPLSGKCFYTNEHSECKKQRRKDRKNPYSRQPKCECTCGNWRIKYVSALAARTIYNPCLQREGKLQKFEDLEKIGYEAAWVIEMKHSTGKTEEELNRLEQQHDYEDGDEFRKLDYSGFRKWNKKVNYDALKEKIQTEWQTMYLNPCNSGSTLPPRFGWEIAFVSAEMQKKWKPKFLAEQHSSPPSLSHQYE